MDYLSYLLIGVITCLIGYATWKIVYFLRNFDKFLGDFVQNFLKKAVSDESLQVDIYKVAGIAGQGLQAGLGIKNIVGTGSKKFKLEDIGMQLLGSFVENIGKNPSSSPGPPASPQLTRNSETKEYFK